MILRVDLASHNIWSSSRSKQSMIARRWWYHYLDAPIVSTTLMKSGVYPATPSDMFDSIREPLIHQ